MSHLTSYKELIFWQKSRTVSLQTVNMIRKLPYDIASKIIINQLLRASFSVGANIAEGFGKYLGKEYCRFLQISLGSAREVEYWLELLKDIDNGFENEIIRILNTNSEVIKMLVVTLKNLKKSDSSL